MPMTTMQLACEEREEFADLLTGLSPAQWGHPSLCGRWRVHDVAAHVISYDELSRWQVARRFIRGGLVVPRINAIGVAEYAGRSPDQLIELMRACIPPRGFTAGFGGMIALVDGMIHQQDIRRPLGIPRTIPPMRLRTVMDYALRVPLVRGGWRTRDLRLVATDLDWVHGSGPGVTGPGEALLMAMAGRPDALHQLGGRGKDLLAQRICG
ncbi:MAG: maleylpyruvate isomerase family mycothiol-dependent enzyme [Mycobacterium sp.]